MYVSVCKFEKYQVNTGNNNNIIHLEEKDNENQPLLKTKVTTEIIEASESKSDENSVNQKGLDKPFKTENDPVSLAIVAQLILLTGS